MTTPTGDTQPAPASQRPTAAQMAALATLLIAQAATRRQLTQVAVAAATAVFGALTPADWWDSGKISRAVRDVLRVVQPAQRQAARVTDAYITRAAAILTGRRAGPAGTVDITRLRRDMPDRIIEDLAHGRIATPYLLLGELDLTRRQVIAGQGMDQPADTVVPDPGETLADRIRRRRGEQATAQAAQETAATAQAVDPGQPYGRVTDRYRYQVVARGSPHERARAYALAHVTAVAATDVTLAIREQERASIGGLEGVTGYRRVVRPELTETGPCGLCVVAADRVYKVRDLRPLHDRCVCTVLPIIGDLDPGLFLNRGDLSTIYERAGSTAAADLKTIRVALAEHGELGPLLVDADRHYRGPADVAKTRTADRKVRLRNQLDEREAEYAALVRRQLAGESVDVPLRWQTDRIEGLRRELAAL